MCGLGFNGEKQKISLSSFIPSIITILGLCFSMSAIRYAFEEKWQLSVILIVLAAITDGVDGRVARFLKANSDFGKQLDSMIDLISFGVAPAIISYLWSLHDINIKGVGWSISIFLTICTVVRLARFNIEGGGSSVQKNNAKDAVKLERKKQGTKQYFFGIPAPAGAVLSLLPLTITFDYKIYFFQNNPALLAVYLIVIALMMASTIPTFSIKHITIHSRHSNLIFILLASVIICLTVKPWTFIPIFSLFYIISIFVSYYLYYRNYFLKEKKEADIIESEGDK